MKQYPGRIDPLAKDLFLTVMEIIPHEVHAVVGYDFWFYVTL